MTPLGIVSPVTLVGKMIFREVCDRHLPWDKKLSDNLGQKWLKFFEKPSRAAPVSKKYSRV